MGKYLNGSAKTGKKILDNWNLFSFTEAKLEVNTTPVLYKFDWNFDGQKGYISISVKDNKISNSSLIDTNSNTTHPFGRPLGLYNDHSLEQVFTQMLASINVTVSGVYAEPF